MITPGMKSSVSLSAHVPPLSGEGVEGLAPMRMDAPSLLIVEDEPVVSMDLKYRITQLGYHVTGIAATGSKALALAEEGRPDLVLMDIGLQGPTDGIETACEMRRRFHLPVVFLTAYAETGTWQQAKRAAPFGYLLKPFDDRELHISIEMALYKHSTERQLQASEEKFRVLMESARDGILLISSSGAVMTCNAAFASMHGYTVEEILAMSLNDLTAPTGRRLTPGRFQRLLGGETMLFEVEHSCKNGQILPLEVAANRIFIHDEILVLGSYRDISERRRNEQILLEWNRTLERRVAERTLELQQAQRLALVSEISTGIIHQLGQPLCAMGVNIAASLANMKACASQPCSSIAILNDVEFDIGRLRDSVIRLRALAHTEPPVRMPVDLNHLLEDSLRLLRHEFASHPIRLSLVLGDDLPPLFADAVQLSQVILNLTRNAFAACAQGPSKQGTVTLTTRSLPGEGVELCVRDTGPGIVPEDMKRLFTPFFTTKPGGLGMGLRLSRIIVQGHDGRIEASNNPDGIGATFRVVLPLQPVRTDSQVPVLSTREPF